MQGAKRLWLSLAFLAACGAEDAPGDPSPPGDSTTAPVTDALRERLRAQRGTLLALARARPESASVTGVDFYVHPTDDGAVYAHVFCNCGGVPPDAHDQLFRASADGWQPVSAPPSERPGQSMRLTGVWETDRGTVAIVGWTGLCQHRVGIDDDAPLSWVECEHQISHDGGETYAARIPGAVAAPPAGGRPWRAIREPRAP